MGLAMANAARTTGAIRRFILTAAALVAAAASPLALSLAEAREHGGGHGRGGYERDGGRFERGGGPPGRPDWYARPERRDRRDEPPPMRRFEEPRPMPAPEMRRGGRLRPGAVLPPEYRGPPVYDYGRYRLRPPPHGYAWVRVGGGYALVSLIDGRIFDIVPD
jgi:Ni/Co efflux regulator RcnB